MNLEIAPFGWIEHDDGSASVTLYASENYKKKLFKARKREGFVGSGYDWEALAEVFIREKAPDLERWIEFDPEHLMFCAYSGDANALKQFITQFRDACENDDVITDLFSRAAPPERITLTDMRSILGKIFGSE